MKIPSADVLLHTMVVVFMAVVLWMLQSLVSTMQLDRSAQLKILDRVSALEVKVHQLEKTGVIQ